MRFGGVTIDVPEAFTAIDGTVFPAGEQRMNGTQALSYARHRGDAEGDFGRIKRQQQVIRALIRETGGLEVLTSIREFLPAIQQNLRTDLSVPQMIDLATTYRSICTEDAVTMLRLRARSPPSTIRCSRCHSATSSSTKRKSAAKSPPCSSRRSRLRRFDRRTTQT